MAQTGISRLKLNTLVFDGFGTLFDLESATPAFDVVFPGRGLEVLRWWRGRRIDLNQSARLGDHTQRHAEITFFDIYVLCNDIHAVNCS